MSNIAGFTMDVPRHLFSDMQPGCILEITVADASTATEQELGVSKAVVRLQVVSLPVGQYERIEPIYRVLEDTRALYGDSRSRSCLLTAGTLARAGFEAMHIPVLNPNMWGFGGLAIGRDYSLEDIGGSQAKAFLCSLSHVNVLPPPADWAEPTEELAAYLSQCALSAARYDQRLDEEIAVYTLNSVYRFSAVTDKSGRRTVRKNDEEPVLGRLFGASIGESMRVEMVIAGESKAITTSPVTRFEPDPNRDD